MNEGIDQRTRDQPIQEPAAGPYQETDSNGGQKRPVPISHGDSQHGTRERQHRADRKIDPSRDQDQRHPHGDHCEVGNLVDHALKRAPAPEVTAQQAEQDDQESEHDEHGEDIGQAGEPLA